MLPPGHVPRRIIPKAYNCSSLKACARPNVMAGNATNWTSRPVMTPTGRRMCCLRTETSTTQPKPSIITETLATSSTLKTCRTIASSSVSLPLENSVLVERFVKLSINEPRREKTGLRDFRPGPTQTGLYKLRSRLEA